MPILAEKVAYAVLEDKGGRSITEIAVANGASASYARSGALVKTASYQAIIQRDNALTAKRLAKLRNLSMKRATELANTAKFSESVTAIDTTTKNIQLLTGGQTELSVTPILQIAVGTFHFTPPTVDGKVLD